MQHWSSGIARIGLVGLAAALAACPLIRPEPSPEAASRGYPNTTRDQVLQAATEVFLHADPSFALTRSRDGLEASRPWLDTFHAAAPGFQLWQLRLQETDGGVRAWLDVLSQPGRSPASETGMRVVPAMPQDQPEAPEGSAVYELFFGRLEQRLGRRPDWITCDEAAILVREGTLHGSVGALCARFGADLDAVPAGARVVCPAHRPHAGVGEGDRPTCRATPVRRT